MRLQTPSYPIGGVYYYLPTAHLSQRGICLANTLPTGHIFEYKRGYVVWQPTSSPRFIKQLSQTYRKPEGQLPSS